MCACLVAVVVAASVVVASVGDVALRAAAAAAGAFIGMRALLASFRLPLLVCCFYSQRSRGSALGRQHVVAVVVVVRYLTMRLRYYIKIVQAFKNALIAANKSNRIPLYRMPGITVGQN